METRCEEAVARKGFDRNFAGHRFPTVEIAVSRFQISFFADILGLRDPVHHDVAAARAAGYRDLLAPPSFFMALEAAAETRRVQAGLPKTLAAFGADFRYLLHGTEHYTYAAPVCARDVVTFVARVGDFVDKKGGLIEVVDLHYEIVDAAGALLIGVDRTALHRFG